MTWQLSSAIILLVSIGASFYWFEHSRPSARIVAAVAMLVAFAVVGRIIFAPFPNVKPTTDIVIVAGYVLGAEPGIIVGVLAALVSNFYFAQGPWTPWQMFAWGLCGLFGAGLGRLSRQKLTRLPMAICCAAAGLAYGVILNFGSAVNFGGSDVFASFWVYTAGSLPFDAAHAIGNFAFYLLAGPVLVKMLQRLKKRANVVWPQKSFSPARPDAPNRPPISAPIA